jgi:hypothetical protein
LTITDFCGQSTERKITRTIEPGKTSGSSAWFEGFDYDTKCTQNKKYGESFYTRISSIKIEIVKIVEYDSKGKPITDNSGNSNNSSGNNSSGNNSNGNNSNNTSGDNNGNSSGNNSGNNTNNNNGNNNYSQGNIPRSTGGKGDYSSCATITPKISAGYNCAIIDWWCSIGSNMMKGDSLIQHTESQNFIVKWRKKGEYGWKDVRALGCPRGTVILSSLEACTKYEVVLVRDCGKGVIAASDLQEFTTACNSPEMLNIINITKTSASVSHRIRSAPIPCGTGLTSYVSVVEYKTGTGPWDTLVCVKGGGCTLNALTPGTTYRVRVRFRFDNNKYSEYSKEVAFTTNQ